MTEHDFVLMIEKLAIGICKDTSPYAGKDGAMVAHGLGVSLLLLIGALKYDAKALGALMAIDEMAGKRNE